MKTERGMRILLLLCGPALVGAELRATAEAIGDRDPKNKQMKFFLRTHFFPNTRTLQTASCSAYPVCVELFGGADKVLPESMCCPTPYGQRMSCCDDNRENPLTGNEPTIPVPISTTPPTPTTPSPTTPAPPTAPPTTPPASTTPAATTPVVDASCLAHSACMELFGGADKVIPGSMCCPTPYGQRLSCCDDNRNDPPNGSEPTIPLPISTTPPGPTTPAVDSSCSAHPACIELFGGAEKVLPGSMCCPTPYGQRLSCCDDNRNDPPNGSEPTIPLPIPTTPQDPTTPAVDSSCSAHPACVELFGGAEKVLPGSMCCPTPYGQRMSCCDA